MIHPFNILPSVVSYDISHTPKCFSNCVCRYPKGNTILCYMFVGIQPLTAEQTAAITPRTRHANIQKYLKKISIRKMRLCVSDDVCVAPLRKVCYPQGNKGLKLADGNKQNLAYRYYCCTVSASALMYNVHEKQLRSNSIPVHSCDDAFRLILSFVSYLPCV